MRSRIVSGARVAGEVADVDTAHVNACRVEAREHSATRAADLQRRSGLQSADDLRHEPLVRVDRQHPHAGLLIETVLEDRPFDRVEGGGVLGDERADRVTVVVDEVDVAVGCGRVTRRGG